MQIPIEWLPAEGAPEQLIVLLHGVGAQAMAMAALAQALRSAFPQAAVLVPDAPHAFDGGGPGRQWFSVTGITEDNRPARIAAALPPLLAFVRAQQQRLGVGPAATAIAGFSQGAILALHLAVQQDGLAGRVLAFAGRFATLPTTAPHHTTVYLFHGNADPVIPAVHASAALQHLGALQGDATLDIAEGIGHELHPALVQCALHRLKTHIPLRTWQAALGAVPRTQDQAGDDQTKENRPSVEGEPSRPRQGRAQAGAGVSMRSRVAEISRSACVLTRFVL